MCDLLLLFFNLDACMPERRQSAHKSYTHTHTHRNTKHAVLLLNVRFWFLIFLYH
jgi:hypothetical protein